MEVRYKRDMNHNFLILDGGNESGYEMNMILNNRIQGLLVSQRHTFNGCAEIYYDISSRQPLDRIYAKKEMKAEDIRGLLLSVHLVIKELKRYLLDSNSIIFEPQFCYCSLETRKPEWLYYPLKMEGSGMRELAEFLIDRVAHEDNKAVDMAYRFYKMVKADLFSPGELETILDTYQEKAEQEKNIYAEEESNIQYSECRENHNYWEESRPSLNEINTPKESFFTKVQELICKKMKPILIKEEKRGEDKFKQAYNVDWESYGL